MRHRGGAAAVGLTLRNRIRRAKSLAAETLSMSFRNSQGGDSVGTPATPMKHYFVGGPNSPSRRVKASTDAALPGGHSCCQTLSGMSASGSNLLDNREYS